METLAFVLAPLIVLLRWALDGLHLLTGSYGLAIIILSLIVRLAMTPVSRRAARAEERHAGVLARMAPELADINAKYKGRERFERTDALYTRHGYHPIQSMASILPLLLQLPFLLAALILLTSHADLRGESFLFLADLSLPDRLLSIPGLPEVNLLPLLLTGVALTEALIKPSANPGGRRRFFIVAVVIAVLIYPLASGVCLYWLSSNVWSLLWTLVSRHAKPPAIYNGPTN